MDRRDASDAAKESTDNSPQYPKEAAVEEGDSVIVEVTPERVASWGID